MFFRHLLALLLFTNIVNAMEVIESPKLTIDEFWVYQDASHHFNSTSILNVDDSKWQHINEDSINLGYQQSTVWIKFRLDSKLENEKNLLLDINYPLLDYVDLYTVIDNQPLKLIQSGDSRPFTNRNFKHPNFITQIKIGKNETQTYLLKLKSNAPIQTQIILWQQDEFQAFYRKKASLTFLYLGILLSTSLFNLVVFVFIRENTFLTYGLYATCFALLMTSQDAILFEYLFPNHPVFHNWSQLILGACTLTLTCLFNLLFLKLDKNKNGRLMYLLSYIPLLILVSSLFIGYATAIRLLVLSILLIIPTCFILGVIHSKGNENRPFYILAWGWLFAGVSIFAVAKLGIIPFNLFTNYSIQLGSALELLTFAVAMAKRLHTEKETRIQAQQLIIDGAKQSAKLQQELLYNATHNDITGLPNRNLFAQHLNDLLKSKREFTVVLIRLSRIAELDKTLGRNISNYILEKSSINLNSHLRQLENISCLDRLEDFYVASISNSTFAFALIDPIDDNIKKKLKSLLQNLNKPILVNDLLIDPWMALGYSQYPNHGEDAQQLLRNAGIALDNASDMDNSISSFHIDQDTYNERRLILINELKNAITQNEMQLLYQPLIDTASENIIGAEALIRWPHNDYGVILPDEFIEIAEQTGIIQVLSLWVFKNALHQLKLWLKINPEFLMSVNISAQNLKDKKFIKTILMLISDKPHIAKNIILEVTETQMMGDTHHTLENLWLLHEKGFNIAIDDFGTGYSNLSYLKKLPANELKIDKTFILNLESDKQNQVLVQTAIQMAHNLGLKVVAEGVESERCREILSSMGCDMCQGFHFSRPIPHDQFNKLFELST